MSNSKVYAVYESRDTVIRKGFVAEEIISANSWRSSTVGIFVLAADYKKENEAQEHLSTFLNKKDGLKDEQ